MIVVDGNSELAIYAATSQRLSRLNSNNFAPDVSTLAPCGSPDVRRRLVFRAQISVFDRGTDVFFLWFRL
jgi:hypothetical protein